MKLIASQIDLLLQQSRVLLERLNLPTKDEYIIAAQTAFHDVKAASISSWNLTYISFRPIFILLGIISHYLAIVLRVIAKHSVAHGWIAAKEGYYQLRIATIWFIQFQKDLSTTAKYVECGVLALIVLLWMLRRHVKKQRYVERTLAWYNNKKRKALRKYYDVVDRVAKTSLFLASLLPHVLYLLMVIVMKRMIPINILSYLASRTYLCTIISFWHPLYMTMSVLGRLSIHLRVYKKEEDEQKDYDAQKSGTNSWKGKTMTPSKLKGQRRQKIELEELRLEVVELLKYWVVYAILLAIVRTGKLLPVIGHVLNATTTTTEDVVKEGSKMGYFAKKASSSGLYSKLRLSGKFVEEVTLVFFVWLRLMPASITGGEASNNGKGQQTVSKSSTWRSQHDLNKQQHNGRPVDILFGKLSPIVLSAMNSSAFLTKRALGESSGKNDDKSVLSVVIQKFKSILDLFVLVRLISKDTQDWIITTIVESSALLPAVTTLLMPSYFTNYGIIYVSLVVPAGYSITSCNSIRKSSSSKTLESMMPAMDDASRYLQFWVVHAAVSLLLESFAPLLAWLPLSTHATWLLWAYVQLESSTRKIYSWFESELGKKSLEETTIVRSTRRIIAALPSNVDDSEPNETKSKITDTSLGTKGEKDKVA